jgi:hypothetical protein
MSHTTKLIRCVKCIELRSFLFHYITRNILFVLPIWTVLNSVLSLSLSLYIYIHIYTYIQQIDVRIGCYGLGKDTH